MRIESKLLALATLFVVAISPASATIYVPEPITYYYDAAEIVARVRVMGGQLLEGDFEGESYPCGQRVNAKVVESLKGTHEMVEFVIDGMLLEMGTDYLVFIERADSERKDKLVSTNSIHLRDEFRRQQACQNIVMTHRVSWLSTARFLRHFNRETQEADSWLWPAYNIAIPEDAGIRFQSVKVHSLEVDGKVVTDTNFRWGRDAVIPSDIWMYEGAFEWESFHDYLLSVTDSAKAKE